MSEGKNYLDYATPNGEIGEKSGKKVYRSPALVTYGLVRELTMANTMGTFSDNSSMVMVGSSDPELKENVRRVGEHSAGFGLYLFDYKAEFRDQFGHGRQFGVMADEVERILPQAVIRDVNGYRMVRYDLLGIFRSVN